MRVLRSRLAGLGSAEEIPERTAALLPLPCGYYTLLRIVVCGAGAFGAFQAFNRPETRFWTFVLGGLAILFNPLIPVHLTREIWAPIDVGTAALFGAAAVWLAPKIDLG